MEHDGLDKMLVLGPHDLHDDGSFSIVIHLFQELFQRQQGNPSGQCSSSMMSSHCQTGQSTKSHPSSPSKGGRVYSSVAEMKRKGKVRLGASSDPIKEIHCRYV